MSNTLTGRDDDGQSHHQEEELEWELLRCARRGDFFDRARELIEIERVSVNCTDKHGWTPLMFAIRYRNDLLARLLLENDANIDAASNGGRTALVCAVTSGNVALAQLLLEHGANVEKQFSYCGYMNSPLSWAIYKCNAGMVALLLRFGANTEETVYDDKSYTALYLACMLSDVEIVQLLLNHNDGVDVNAFQPSENDPNVVMSPLCRSGDRPAMSPLCHACQRDNLEMVQLLVQHGARVIFDGVYPDVPSPLVEAVKCGSMELVRLLLDNSRFSETVNDNVRLQQVRIENHPLSPALESAIRENEPEAAQLLVDRGANVNDRPFLWLCANFGGLGTVRLLLRAGANVNLADRESGETPLWAATKKGHCGLVKEFLKARADVRIHDNNGETPLGVAYRRGRKGIVYLLLRTSPHVRPKLKSVL